MGMVVRERVSRIAAMIIVGVGRKEEGRGDGRGGGVEGRERESRGSLWVDTVIQEIQEKTKAAQAVGPLLPLLPLPPLPSRLHLVTFPTAKEVVKRMKRVAWI
jgi:hypothetical protein